MNLTMYKHYPKVFAEIKKNLIDAINSCNNAGELAATLDFHSGYIGAIDHFENVRYEEVTDEMISAYFEGQKNK